MTIELETLTDGAASITAAKKKKSSSSTTVIEVGGEMRMKMAHADAASMTKCSEVKSRAKIITDSDELKKKRTSFIIKSFYTTLYPFVTTNSALIITQTCFDWL